jgi:lipopolysaccharide transport system permease protein
MKEEKWDIVILPKSSLFSFSFKELWQYRDLIYMFVKRDFVSIYKQTILGPLWFFIQPVFTTIMYWIVFSRIANISTDHLNPILFYMSGVLFWNYFSTVVLKVSDTFVSNAGVFGKVYFPRLTVPISVVLSSLFTFFIQFTLLIFVTLINYWQGSWEYKFVWYQLWLLPFLIFFMAISGLGLGTLISALTTKYRDMKFLITFGIQIFMYATPVVYPLSILKDSEWRDYFYWNPMAVIIESFRAVYLEGEPFDWSFFLMPIFIVLLIVVLGVGLFNKIEKTFMDTV